jgi:S-adenosylmethionine hydrolase
LLVRPGSPLTAVPIITLLTDYGLRDSYVAELKGALLSALPGALIVDITHEIPRGNIFAAQYVLGRAWSRFPGGTVHVAVVDPTVGTQRRAIAALYRGHRFVAPDNGLLTPVLGDARVVELPVPPGAAPTFQGRDVFAPAAGSLAAGTSFEMLGQEIRNPVRTPLPVVRRDGKDVIGCVVYVDRFGTLVTNVADGTDPTDPAGRFTRAAWPGGTAVVAGRVAPVRRTFADVAPGELVAFLGSGGTMEVAVRDGSAAEVLGVKEGAEVRLRTAP